MSVLGEMLLGLQAMQAYYPKDSTFQDLSKNTLAQGPYLCNKDFCSRVTSYVLQPAL